MSAPLLSTMSNNNMMSPTGNMSINLPSSLHSTTVPVINRPAPVSAPRLNSTLPPVTRSSPARRPTPPNGTNFHPHPPEEPQAHMSPKTVVQRTQSKVSRTLQHVSVEMSVSDSFSLESESHSASQPNRQLFSIEILVGGYVQSYVDFFYITHREQQATEHRSDQDLAEVEIPQETMVFLKETLTVAESQRRMGDSSSALQNYRSLAEYFESINDYRTGLYFYDRCLDVAKDSKDHEGKATAYLRLGMCQEKLRQMGEAMKCHEASFNLARDYGLDDLKREASVRLVEVYKELAYEKDKQAESLQAVKYHEKCLEAAVRSENASLEGGACYRLGLACDRQGGHEKSISLFKRYLDLCQQNNDKVGEGQARAALANAFENLDDAESAIMELEGLLEVSQSTGEIRSQAEACFKLGMLFNLQGDHDKSVNYLEQHFELVRQLGDRDLIDAARVHLGMARGNSEMGSYVSIVNADLTTLLKWKNRRAPLASR
eukprot:GILK01002645.1.p1 GENE.GILK01002645.1~~GILK01002645.1.p1  ORF type:complete len:489 (-),score=60.33 GILK01002645.1:201-1667(-)